MYVYNTIQYMHVYIHCMHTILYNTCMYTTHTKNMSIYIYNHYFIEEIKEIIVYLHHYSQNLQIL